ncbi:MAG: endopeptidase La [Clostridia bacterium]|nr:endopeptidase La [Clostridia bacterium]
MIYNLPVLPLRGIVVFPGIQIHFDVERKSSIAAIKEAFKNEQLVFLVSQKDASVDKPTPNDIYHHGTLAKISHFIKTSENTYRVVVTSKYKAYANEIKPGNGFMLCDAQKCEITNDLNLDIPEDLQKYRELRDKTYAYFTTANNNVPDVIVNSFDLRKPLSVLCDNICANLLIEPFELQQLLKISDIRQLFVELIKFLNREIKIIEIDAEIQGKVKQKIDKNQREYYLNEQLKTIKNELGNSDEPDDIYAEYYEKILALKLPEVYEKKLVKEVSKLENMSSHSSEAGVITSYLDLVLDLPWNTFSEDNLDVKTVNKVLNENHFGLDEVKERIIEYIAVKQLHGRGNGNIICLSGPPGVGKTTIAESLANAIGRKYIRISLGGLKDESEIRGHRKTYVGAMPGRIINAFKQAECLNPLILLDEIDKIGSDYKGDPTSALLEVLDNGQNREFKDNYLEIPFDISNAIYIATANDMSQIPAPLFDRMDIISIPGYTFEEKIQIAKKHLIPAEIKNHAVKNVVFSDDAISEIINSYTREAGVRSLDRFIQKICRKCAVKIVSGEQKSMRITKNTVTKYLGTKLYTDTLNKKNNLPGMVTGLAWTQYGGDVLTVEVTLMEGDGKLKLTGNLGDVMKESAEIAYSYLKSNCKKYGIEFSKFKNNDVHIHVPEGAVPKDGPSAGVTIVTALISALTNKKFKSGYAMTGEITLTGRVLPIGGLRVKSLAALQNNICTVFIPEENSKNINDISETAREKIKFITVSDVFEIVKNSLDV